MAGDVLFNDVVLLLHCDGSDGGTTFTDVIGHTVTVGGNAHTETDQKKFGTASLQLDGSGDYLESADSTDWNLGSGDFCIELWGYSVTKGGASSGIIIGQAPSLAGTSTSWALHHTGTNIYFSASSGTGTWNIININGADSTSATWRHYCVERYGSTITIYVNGTSVASGTPSTAFLDAAYALRIGDGTTNVNPLSAYLDEIRFTKAARYKGNFTPPSAAFADYQENAGTGSLVNQSAAIAGSGTVQGERTGTGTLAAQSATISGSGRAFTTLAGTGALAGQSASIAGLGGLPITASVPITMGVLFPVRIGLPIRIDIYSAVTPSLPITIGPYPITPTLPITFKTPVVASLPSLTITFPGSYAAIVSDLLEWTPKCVLDGTNISSKLIGAQDIEFEEGAAPVATFSFIPAAGSVDPLLYVGKTVKLSITIGTATYLAFTGVVSDPVWNADDRTITVSATGDLQSRLDRMSKTAILAQVGGTFSEYIFDDPDNLSGWEYAEALLSTQPKVIWQDANGAIRTTSILAKATADYTFTEADILDTAQVVRWAGRMDIVNTLNVNLGYRFQRRRQRNMRFSFRPYQLETPSMYLSGNEGGWELPQRSQIESAANGGGWTVIGEIDYEPIWPQNYYSTYSDSGQPMMAGLTYSVEEAGNLCIGATWTAAKRWLQTITEQYTLAVTATDSIEAVGTLATDESYAIEDDATDEEWESSLDYDDYVSGALVMGNGVDKKADLDELRSDVTTAMSVALAKAQNDVLKSHRGTTVGFFSTYDPRIDLRHTVEVDTAYLGCKGKVRRIAHHWDIDTGDATTEIEVALSRHNGTGLASSDTLTPPSEPADPTETVPATTYRLGMHIGGQDDRPVWNESWDGYICNVAMVGLDKFGGAAYPSTSTTNLASQYSLANTWQRDPSNPALIGRIYEPGMHILPPEIAAEYADPADVTATSTYDVEVPEDPLVLISG